MEAEKTFYRVRLIQSCRMATKQFNGVTLTKQWQTKSGSIDNFTKFKDVEVQLLQKQGNQLVPTGSILVNGVPVAAASAPTNPSTTPTSVETTPIAELSGETPPVINFSEMTVEQLKEYLTSNGVPMSEIRSLPKADLVNRAVELFSSDVVQ